MILELRTYDHAPLDAQRYLALFRADGLPLITRHLPLVGYWPTEGGPLNRIEHPWAHESLADRAARWGRLMGDSLGPDAGAGDDALLAACIVAGDGAGQRLTLRSADDPAALGPAHEILRPASFSPL